MVAQQRTTDIETGRVGRLYDQAEAAIGKLPAARRQALKEHIMATDADTLANAHLLWELVHRVQEAIHKDGSPNLTDMTEQLRAIRKLADECDPENGKW